MTIIETIPIFEAPENYIYLIPTGLLGTVITSLLLVGTFNIGNKIITAIFTTLSIIGMLVCLVGLFLTIFEPEVDTGRKQYIVRLDNNVSINEFYDNYKIIDHTKYTDIYTVEEIEK